MVETFKIIITEKANYKLEQYYKLADKEVGGVFEVEMDGDEIKIVDTLLLPQEVTGGDFVLDEEGLSKFSKKIFVKSPEKMEKFKGWWHKHPIEGWSGHDDNTFKTLLDTFGGKIVGLVCQGSGEILCRVDMKDKRSTVSFNTLDYGIITKKINRKQLKKFCKKEYDKKVKEKDFGVANYNTNYGAGSYYQHLWNDHSNDLKGWEDHSDNLKGYDDHSDNLKEWEDHSNDLLGGFNRDMIDKGGYVNDGIPKIDDSHNILRNKLSNSLRLVILNELAKDKEIFKNCKNKINCIYCEFATICHSAENEQKEQEKLEVMYYD